MRETFVVATISFYRQRRRDGDLRMGLEVSGDTVAQQFIEGSDEPDPAIEWFLDVRAQGNRLPRSALGIEKWFRDHAAVIRTGLRALADQLPAGIDADSWPLQWPIPGAPAAIKLHIVCSAIRRSRALAISDQLRDTADHWEDYLNQLRPLEPAQG